MNNFKYLTHNSGKAEAINFEQFLGNQCENEKVLVVVPHDDDLVRSGVNEHGIF